MILTAVQFIVSVWTVCNSVTYFLLCYERASIYTSKVWAHNRTRWVWIEKKQAISLFLPKIEEHFIQQLNIVYTSIFNKQASRHNYISMYVHHLNTFKKKYKKTENYKIHT